MGSGGGLEPENYEPSQPAAFPVAQDNVSQDTSFVVFNHFWVWTPPVDSPVRGLGGRFFVRLPLRLSQEFSAKRPTRLGMACWDHGEGLGGAELVPSFA